MSTEGVTNTVKKANSQTSESLFRKRKENPALDLAEFLRSCGSHPNPTPWTELCPELTITENVDRDHEESSSSSRRRPIKKMAPLSEGDTKRRKKRLVCDGYALVDDSVNVDLVPLLRSGIEILHQNGLPASLILLFDETWLLAQESKRTLEAVSNHRNFFNFDLLAWYIPPGKEGFSPHRDRQPDHAPSTFHPDDHLAKFITQWIALSEATPENSCLYVIPKPYDPGYMDGDSEETGDPLRRALPTKESYQNIRALPRKPGQSVLFTHRIIHWGSRGHCHNVDGASDIDSEGPPPRIAISFVCSDPDFEKPLLVNHPLYFSSQQSHTTIPPFRIRLLLVCAQLLIYYQRFDLDRHVIKACYDYCKANQDELEENYRKRVFLEFVKAMKEVQSTDTVEIGTDKETVNPSVGAPTVDDGHKQSNHDSDGDEEDDALLDAMLDAEKEGYGEFEDDYDELESKEEGEDTYQADRASGEEKKGATDDDDDEEDDGDETELNNIFFGVDKRQQDDTEDTKHPVKKMKST